MCVLEMALDSDRCTSCRTHRYGLIRDAPLFGWLEENMDKLMARDTVATAYAIERSCINKAEVGRNTLLDWNNFGWFKPFTCIKQSGGRTLASSGAALQDCIFSVHLGRL